MILDQLKSFGLLAEFSDEDRECLAELVEEQTVLAGRRIFGEGTEAEGLVLVVSGSVTLESRYSGVAETLAAPVALGGLALVAVGPRESMAIAETECAIIRLARTSYRRLVDDYPRTACRLIEAVLAEVAGLLRMELDRISSD